MVFIHKELYAVDLFLTYKTYNNNHVYHYISITNTRIHSN